MMGLKWWVHNLLVAALLAAFVANAAAQTDPAATCDPTDPSANCCMLAGAAVTTWVDCDTLT